MSGKPLVLFAVLLAVSPCAFTQTMHQPLHSGTTMHAKGTFEVKIVPAEPSSIAKEADTGRMTIDKTWSGDITGTSKGEMLTGLTPSTGAMAYVAIERMHVTVAGHTGTFLFSHSATMQKGDAASASLFIRVVPNSGTDGLEGIEGSLAIDRSTGIHRYDFTYTLPSSTTP